MHSLARHFSSFCRPEPLLRERFSYFKLRAALTFIKLFNKEKKKQTKKNRRKLAYSRRKVQCRKESNIALLEPRLNKAKKKQKEKVTNKQYFTAALQLVPRCHTP